MSDSTAQNPQSGSLHKEEAGGLLLLTGLIHLIFTPQHLEEATYLGLLFAANFVGAVVAAYGIYREQRWGWVLGACVAGGAYVFYIVSGMIGLPGVDHSVEAHPGQLWDPPALYAKAAEALFLILCSFKLAEAFPPPRRWALVLGVAVVLAGALGVALAFDLQAAFQDGYDGSTEHH